VGISKALLRTAERSSGAVVFKYDALPKKSAATALGSFAALFYILRFRWRSTSDVRVGAEPALVQARQKT